ncbi:hypothetical protein EUGRSUZ_J02560 [Eucalyptus grandis]|uniref:Uncharacterized protein n=2 Tax=Eucalyptus grandis TaxID=71139 RepID=A0ACC3J9A8_EUCGR|nr:hypothetical protein EUGRSUZ_J02560 [Eucalyptus grandis]
MDILILIEVCGKTSLLSTYYNWYPYNTKKFLLGCKTPTATNRKLTSIISCHARSSATRHCINNSSLKSKQ